MIIDSHAHLDDEKLKEMNIVERMFDDGLSRIITIGTNVVHSKNAIEIAEQNKNIFATVGVHPEYATETTMQDLENIDKLCDHEKVVAVGEIGLDYFYDKSNKEKQKQIFIKQLEIAHKHGLPVVLHIRDAMGDAIEILKANKHLLCGGVAHCYSGSTESAKILIGLGFYISFSGTITFKSVNRDILNHIPTDKILVETDCPYLAPEPVRGTINEPKNVLHTARKIADYLDIPFEMFCEIIEKNCKSVFKKLK